MVDNFILIFNWIFSVYLVAPKWHSQIQLIELFKSLDWISSSQFYNNICVCVCFFSTRKTKIFALKNPFDWRSVNEMFRMVRGETMRMVLDRMQHSVWLLGCPMEFVERLAVNHQYCCCHRRRHFPHDFGRDVASNWQTVHFEFQRHDASLAVDRPVQQSIREFAVVLFSNHRQWMLVDWLAIVCASPSIPIVCELSTCLIRIFVPNPWNTEAVRYFRIEGRRAFHAFAVLFQLLDVLYLFRRAIVWLPQNLTQHSNGFRPMPNSVCPIQCWRLLFCAMMHAQYPNLSSSVGLYTIWANQRWQLFPVAIDSPSLWHCPFDLRSFSVEPHWCRCHPSQFFVCCVVNRNQMFSNHILSVNLMDCDKCWLFYLFDTVAVVVVKPNAPAIVVLAVSDVDAVFVPKPPNVGATLWAAVVVAVAPNDKPNDGALQFKWK